MVAFAQPGGVTTRHAWQTLRDELLADLRAALPVQMVLLGLHGAMVADGCDDCEGELLREVRAIVGPGVVVGAELDPHHHLSPAMCEHADLLVSFKQYPHTDVLERAFELVDLCAATAAGRIRPTLGVADCDMISIVHTTREPARSFVDRMQALEGRDGVLSISVTHGFPWGDVADMGTRVFVYTDGNAGQAQALARRLADELYGLRDALQPPQPDIDEALDQALAALDATDPAHAARWCWPTAPTTRAAAPRATPPSCCAA
jgi:microcystin degradation protein MlrC